MKILNDLNDLRKDYPLNYPAFTQHLYILGLSLLAISIVYLVAANWFMLPKMIQLGMPPFFLFISASASIYFDKNFSVRQALDAISGLMLGLSLAVIGQIYQTGANSYQLFLMWTLLLLPWLYRPNIGVYALFSITSLIALVLFFDQTFWLQEQEVICLFIINLWSALLFAFCVQNYPTLKWFFLIWIAVLSLSSIVAFIWRDGWNLGYLLLSFLLPVISFLYFQSKNQSLPSTMSILIVGMNFTFLMMYGLTAALGSYIPTMLLGCALVVLSWFTILSSLLKQKFPNSQFNNIPLVIGAWLAGVILAMLLLVSWEKASLILSIIVLIIAIFSVKKSKEVFAKQFSYCLLVCGQVGVLSHFAIILDSALALFIAQLIIVAVYFFTLKLHWFMLYLQITALYLFAMYNLLKHGLFGFYYEELNYCIALILTYCVYGLVFFTRSISDRHYKKTVYLTLLTIFLTSLYLGPINYGWNLKDFKALNPTSIVQLICVMTWIICSLRLIVKPQATKTVQIGFMFLSSIVIGCGYFELLPIFFILTWALKQDEKLIYGLCIVSIILYLWKLYYVFDISFLIKSLSLFITGVVLLVVARQLNHHNKKSGEIA